MSVFLSPVIHDDTKTALSFWMILRFSENPVFHILYNIYEIQGFRKTEVSSRKTYAVLCAFTFARPALLYAHVCCTMWSLALNLESTLPDLESHDIMIGSLFTLLGTMNKWITSIQSYYNTSSIVYYNTSSIVCAGCCVVLACCIQIRASNTRF